ncbi:hypothetical protein P7L70_02160 (plasmid) [Tistrella mobilis]|uniref:hypothetical protein n=1 Tax=Tistrella mobilis TaxID=171437 RepID=UPI00355751EE
MLKLRIADRLEFTARVSVEMPNDRGGFDRASFTARFEMLPDTEIDAIRRSAQEAGENEDKALMRRALIGWENDLQDAETGEPIAFSDDNRDLLLALLPVRNAVAHAYFASISNGMIRRKN